jgi:hypothetical protein
MNNASNSVDTRFLFNKMTSKKPSSWEDLTCVNQFDDDQLMALRKLPKLTVSENFGTFDRHEEINRFFRKKDRTEFILVRLVGDTDEPDEQYYYVNSEGYDYCRYAFRIGDGWREIL